MSEQSDTRHLCDLSRFETVYGGVFLYLGTTCVLEYLKPETETEYLDPAAAMAKVCRRQRENTVKKKKVQFRGRLALIWSPCDNPTLVKELHNIHLFKCTYLTFHLRGVALLQAPSAQFCAVFTLLLSGMCPYLR